MKIPKEVSEGFQKWWCENFPEITDEDHEKDFAFRGYWAGVEDARRVYKEPVCEKTLLKPHSYERE